MLGIYIHIPFCIKKCDYCDFYSVPVPAGEAPHERYLAAIIGQLKRDVEDKDLFGRKVPSIYFGGGTPSIMPPEFFRRIIAALSEDFLIEPDAEVSAEVNPSSAQEAWFGEMKEAGITRVSIGVQSLSGRLLKELGRIHSANDAMRAIAEAQETGFKSVGIDLMYAIPGESTRDLEDDIRAAMTFQAEHVSAYQLTIENGTPMSSRTAVNEDEQLKQMRIVARMLPRGGWRRYEISNFAKPGFECRHNLNYWRYGEYLGLGAGAASFLYMNGRRLPMGAAMRGRTKDEGRGTLRLRSGQARDEGRKNQSSTPLILSLSKDETRRTKDDRKILAKRFTQIRDVKKYMEWRGELSEDEDIGIVTAMSEFCFMALRTTEGISPARFKENFERGFEEEYGKKCAQLIAEGLLEKKDECFALTSKGVELSNQVFQRFLR